MKSKYIKILILFIIITLGVYVCYKKFFYYKNASETEWIEGREFDFYSANSETLVSANLAPSETNKYNESHINELVETKMQAIRITQEIAEIVYDGCKREQPFSVYFNENAQAWIVHGNLKQEFTIGRSITLGGVITVAIDKQTGNILLVQHTV